LFKLDYCTKHRSIFITIEWLEKYRDPRFRLDRGVSVFLLVTTIAFYFGAHFVVTCSRSTRSVSRSKPPGAFMSEPSQSCDTTA
jgi:hypothetical protein